MYSKKAVAAFATAQKNVAIAGPSLARAYQEFKAAGAREGAGDRGVDRRAGACG